MQQMFSVIEADVAVGDDTDNIRQKPTSAPVLNFNNKHLLNAGQIPFYKN